MIKIKVLEPFYDTVEKVKRNIGDEFTVDEVRYKQMSRYVEKVIDSKTTRKPSTEEIKQNW